MIQKIKKNLIDFFKSPKEVISFFAPILLALILIIPTNYTVTVGGGIINMDKKIEVASQNKKEGSFNSCYVRELNGTVLSYILGSIIPSFELNKIEDITLENEEKNDYNFREKMYFNNSSTSALKVAFSKIGKKIEIEKEDIYVIYIDKNAKTDIEVGDKIIKVNGKSVKTTDELNDEVRKITGDTINLTVIRNGKEKEVSGTLIEIDGSKKIGIYLASNITYKTNPEVKFNFSDKELGPSGGLIMTLSIYNKLVDVDITKGYKISGTGTIDNDGNVGEIGGVPQKLSGAVRKKSDVFICPKENYEEAMKIKQEKGYDIKIYGVATFDEALEVLNNL